MVNTYDIKLSYFFCSSVLFRCFTLLPSSSCLPLLFLARSVCSQQICHWYNISACKSRRQSCAKEPTTTSFEPWVDCRGWGTIDCDTVEASSSVRPYLLITLRWIQRGTCPTRRRFRANKDKRRSRTPTHEIIIDTAFTRGRSTGSPPAPEVILLAVRHKNPTPPFALWRCEAPRENHQ